MSQTNMRHFFFQMSLQRPAVFSLLDSNSQYSKYKTLTLAWSNILTGAMSRSVWIEWITVSLVVVEWASLTRNITICDGTTSTWTFYQRSFQPHSSSSLGCCVFGDLQPVVVWMAVAFLWPPPTSVPIVDSDITSHRPPSSYCSSRCIFSLIETILCKREDSDVQVSSLWNTQTSVYGSNTFTTSTLGTT